MLVAPSQTFRLKRYLLPANPVFLVPTCRTVAKLLIFAATWLVTSTVFAQATITLDSLPGLTDPDFFIQGHPIDTKALPTDNIPLLEYTVKENDNTWDLLRNYGIEPTNSAYKIFEAINPHLTNKENLYPYSKILVPSVRVPLWQEVIPEGARLLISEQLTKENPCISGGMRSSLPLDNVPELGMDTFYVYGKHLFSTQVGIPTIEISPYRVRPGDTMGEIFNSIGIYSQPNKNGLIHRLNPSISNIDKIYPGQDISVPCFEGNKWRQIVQGEQATPILGPDLQMRSTALEVYLDTPNYGNSISTAINSLEALSSGQPRIPLQTQTHIDKVARNMEDILRSARQHGALMPIQKMIFDAHNQELLANVMALTQQRQFKHRLAVSTSQSGIPIYNLVVYWTSEANYHGNFEYPNQFHTNSSPADTCNATVNLGDIRIWAMTADKVLVSEKVLYNLKNPPGDSVTKLNLLVSHDKPGTKNEFTCN